MNMPFPEDWVEEMRSLRRRVENLEHENQNQSIVFASAEEVTFAALTQLQINLIAGHQEVSTTDHLNNALAFLAHRAVNEQLAAWHLVLTGYFASSNLLFRTVYEIWTTMLYLHTFPDEAKVWWKLEPSPDEKNRMLVGQMRHKLITSDVLAPEHRRVYSFLSEMAHPSADSVYPGLERSPNGQLELVLVGRVSEQKTQDFCKAACAYAGSQAKLLARVLVRSTDQPTELMDRYVDELLDAIAMPPA
jgi:hypothetical protein